MPKATPLWGTQGRFCPTICEVIAQGLVSLHALLHLPYKYRFSCLGSSFAPLLLLWNGALVCQRAPCSLRLLVGIRHHFSKQRAHLGLWDCSHMSRANVSSPDGTRLCFSALFSTSVAVCLMMTSWNTLLLSPIPC